VYYFINYIGLLLRLIKDTICFLAGQTILLLSNSTGFMRIIGVTGTLGAGKGTIVDYLVNQKGFSHFSVRAFLIGEIEKRNMPVDRDSMVVVANSLRTKFGSAYIVEQLYERAKATGNDCVIESLRTPGEVELLQNKGNFYLFAVDADSRLRYDRIIIRNSETDRISYETFIENENREMLSNDPNHQNIKKCIAMADFVLQNNDTIDALYHTLETTLDKII
jgi:dephospho-CoA kinase